MQLNDANSEIEFNRGITSARGGLPGKAGEEDFNLERETLLTRIASIQNQLKMQHEAEGELRA